MPPTMSLHLLPQRDVDWDTATTLSSILKRPLATRNSGLKPSLDEGLVCNEFGLQIRTRAD